MSIFEFIKINKLNLEDEDFSIHRLPPIYQIFLKIFDLGINSNFTPTRDTGDTIGNLFSSKHLVEYSGVCLTNFFNLEELLDDMDFSRNVEILNTHKLIRIGTISVGGGICVGISNENLDKIYLHIGDEAKIIHLSNNIFFFLKNLSFELDDFDECDKHSLYKNWDEDFWRIKPQDFRGSRPYELLDKVSLDKKYIELKKYGTNLLEIENEYRIRGFELPKKFLFW